MEHFIPEPFQFNPLKHHLLFIRDFITERSAGTNIPDNKTLIKEIRHIGTSVMDVYKGEMSVNDILEEMLIFLNPDKPATDTDFAIRKRLMDTSYKIITLSDTSQWVLKFNNNERRFVHLFPARFSPLTFRIKANTLKSALLYNLIAGKDYISGSGLNMARLLLGLSPVKDPAETEAITKMIEILRK